MGKGYRQDRIGEEIRRIISSMLLTGLKDPRLSAMVTINAVDVTRDGSYATCYVTLITATKDEDQLRREQSEVIDGLNSAKGTIKRQLGREMRLRHIPELIFKMDLSMEYGRHINEVLKSIEASDAEKAGKAQESSKDD